MAFIDLSDKIQTAKVLRAIENAVTLDIQKMALKIHERLRGNPPEGTPVDTGWASSNWIPSVGKADRATVGSKENVDQLAGGAGIAALMMWQLGDGQIFIVNNVPYIQALNNGHSQQSPSGFVDEAIEIAAELAFGLGEEVRWGIEEIENKGT